MIKLQNSIKNTKLFKYPKGHITQFYGENPILYQLRVGIAFHNGIDISTFEGDEVGPAHSGVVFEVDYRETGYGAGVWLLGDETWIDKDGDECIWLTVYWHMRKSIPVKVGDRVKVGDLLGHQSNSGFVIADNKTIYWGNAPANKGVHLHFGCMPLKKIDPTLPSNAPGYQMNGKWYRAKYYENGVKGFIDPLGVTEGETDYAESTKSVISYMLDMLKKLEEILRKILIK